MNYNEPWTIDHEQISDRTGKPVAYDEGTLGIGMGDDLTVSLGRRIIACVNACKNISTDRLEKMVAGTLANLLTVENDAWALTESRIADIIVKRMLKACYDPMGKEIAALIIRANLLTLKGEKDD